MSWRCIGALNSRYEWVAQTLGVTFVDPNSWVDEWDFGRDGLHINRGRARHLGQLYCSLWYRRRKTEEEG